MKQLHLVKRMLAVRNGDNSHCRLERKTHCQLKLPREIRLACDLPEAAAAEGNARAVKQRRIESVEGLAAELRLEPLADDHILEYREIPIRLAGAAHIDGRPTLPNVSCGAAENAAGLM